MRRASSARTYDRVTSVAEIAEPAEEYCDVTRPDRDGAALLFDRPAALFD